MIQRIKEIPIQIIRPILYLIVLSIYVMSYVTYSAGNYGGSLSHLLVLINYFILDFSLSYQIDKYPLKIHQLIENRSNNNLSAVYLRVILLLTLIVLIGAYFSFRSIYNLGYFSKSNFLFQLFLVLLIALHTSFWERRKTFKN